MTIDDELLLELFKPDPYGKIGEGALIVDVVGSKDIQYSLEELHWFYRDADAVIMREQTHICPDIVVSGKFGAIAIELENDVKWDFQESLRQMKNYKNKFGDIRAIIPDKYKRFAPAYVHEGFRVYLWSAKRKWKCLRCEHINMNESRIPPKCEGKDEKGKPCTNTNRDEFDLVGLEDTRFKEYTPDS